MYVVTKMMKTHIGNLNQWELLNIEMNKEAKPYIQIAQQNPRHYLVHSEPWSLWLGNRKVAWKLSEPLNDLFLLLRQELIRWIRDIYPRLHLTSLFGMSSKKYITRLSQCISVTKHVVGMCGVGKLTVRWKENDIADCPHCGQFDDASRVWRCLGQHASNTWDRALERLEK
jgi:hypothetical protein